MGSLMQRRHFVSFIAAASAASLLAACGSGSDAEPIESDDTIGELASEPTSPPEPTTPPDTAVPAAEVGAIGVVLSYTESGGFTTREFAFQDPPIVIIAEDGNVITMAATPAVFPGPLVQQHAVQRISPSGADAVISAADDAGLLSLITYEGNDQVADASTSILAIVSDGNTYQHSAYALGMGGGPGETSESDEARSALLEFVTQLSNDIGEFAGPGAIGDAEPYRPAGYQFIAVPLTDFSAFDEEPRIEAWPAGTGIELADATECVAISRAFLGDLFERADQLTVFSQNDVDYQLTVRPAYPGRSC
jgi:hypothetical protein